MINTRACVGETARNRPYITSHAKAQITQLYSQRIITQRITTALRSQDYARLATTFIKHPNEQQQRR